MENQNQEITQAKPKKPRYKKWWIWVIAGVVVLAIRRLRNYRSVYTQR